MLGTVYKVHTPARKLHFVPNGEEKKNWYTSNPYNGCCLIKIRSRTCLILVQQFVKSDSSMYPKRCAIRWTRVLYGSRERCVFLWLWYETICPQFKMISKMMKLPTTMHIKEMKKKTKSWFCKIHIHKINTEKWIERENITTWRKETHCYVTLCD